MNNSDRFYVIVCMILAVLMCCAAYVGIICVAKDVEALESDICDMSAQLDSIEVVVLELEDRVAALEGVYG